MNRESVMRTLETAAPDSKLPVRQARFLDEFILTGNAAEAARKAGYSERGAKVTACRLLTKPNLQQALAAKKQAKAVELELRKDHVIAALLQALNLARSQANPAAIVAAAREIGRLLGFYDPEVVKVPLSAEGARLKALHEDMSDEELCNLASGQITN